MRKIKVLIFIAFLQCLNSAYSQTDEDTIVVLENLNENMNDVISKLDKSIEDHKIRDGLFINTGYSENGYGLLLGYKYFPSKKIRRHFEVSVFAGTMEERNSRYDIPIDLYSLNLGYFINIPYLSSNTNAFKFNVGAGGTIGAETIRETEIELQSNEEISTREGSVYGVYGAVEADIKILKNLSGVIRYTHFYHPISEIGKMKFLLGAGLIFKF